MNLNEIIALIGTALGTLGGGGWLINLRASRRVAKANADKALIDNYEARLESLHQTIDKLNDTEREHASRISELNHALDDKTAQIRKLTTRALDAEEENNRLNKLLLKTTEERDCARLETEHYKSWRCEWPDCKDPRGRKPPRKNNDPYQPPN